MSKYIVTGGAGFIGSHLARRLLSDGHEVLILDNLSTGKRENIPEGAGFIEVDLGQENACRCLEGKNADAILHLAGQSSGEASFDDPYYDLFSHAVSTLNLLRWASSANVRRFMYASSMSVYGDPLYLPLDEKHPCNPKTYYGAAKVAAEAYIKLFAFMGIDATIFRLFSVYGPGQNLANMKQGMVSIYFSYLWSGEPILIKGSLERFRDFTYVDDLVDAWMKALNNPNCYGKTYNLASGVPTRVDELVTALIKSFGLENYPVIAEGHTPGDQFGVYADISSLMEDSGWKPKTDLLAGLHTMYEYEKGRSA